ncbi:helix-turn-helix transcriptional regulator [Micromonospora lupini]|nr:helix-turn-helix transcriptional regulator [Micromonospora lupini]
MIRNEALAAFLRDRRSRVEPRRVGLPGGHRRRVPGLRREEVAQLAGVSVDYYARLEQGRQPTASPGVLSSVARTLCLTDDERRHLFALARVAEQRPVADPGDPVNDRVRQLVAAFGDTPAGVLQPMLDVAYFNAAAAFLYADFATMPARHRNAVRWTMLAPEARERWGAEWAGAAADLVGLLRLHAGQYPGHPRLAEITNELSERSPEFRQLWHDQTVSTWQHHVKTLRHPAFGEMSFTNEFLTLQSAPHLSIVVMAPAEPQRFAAALSASRSVAAAARDGAFS